MGNEIYDSTDADRHDDVCERLEVIASYLKDINEKLHYLITGYYKGPIRLCMDPKHCEEPKENECD